MHLNDLARRALVTLVHHRLDGGPLYRTLPALAEELGVGTDELQAALIDASDWARATPLPDLTATVTCADKAEKHIMLPDDARLEKMGGEAQARAQADRVRDFDWAGWASA